MQATGAQFEFDSRRSLVRVRRVRWLKFSVLVCLALVLVVGCGGDDDDDGDAGATGAATDTATDTGATEEAIKVALVTDVGGLDDRSFNFLANKGLQQAEQELGVEGRVLVSRSPQDYVPNLSTAARQGNDLVIAVGFLMAEALATVATRFPDTNFAIIDFVQGDLEGAPPNVRGLLFKEQEAGYLAGYLAALVEQEAGRAQPTISSVGGVKIPPVDRYIAGYQAGAKAAVPGTNTLNAYSQDFVDQAKCKERAINQIQAGSGVIFQVAGGCGLGALDAAKERRAWGIGVDADQAYLGDHILTSALKKVDVAVLETIKTVQNGEFEGGADTVFDVASGAVGLGEISSEVSQEIRTKVDEVEQQLADGEITDIPETVG
jgi:basic membrane protein A